MFGHFDKVIFLELVKSIETLNLASGQYLFRVGEPDEFIYVVQSGKLHVHILDSDNRITTIKTVLPGDTVSSLLSFIDVLTGHPAPFKTVCAKAFTDSVIIKVPAAAFQDVFDKNPEMLIRVVQMIMARLQRVIFVALHQYLGLTSELIRMPEERVAISRQESIQDDFHDTISQVDQADHNSDMNLAVRSFQAELDINNVEFLQDRLVY